MKSKKKIVVIKIFFLFLLLNISCNLCYGQDSDVKKSQEEAINSVIFYFRFDKSLPEKDYLLNPNSIVEIDRLLTNKDFVNSLDSIKITATCSFDGDIIYNKNLANDRKRAVRTYIYWKYPNIDRNIVYLSSENQDISYIKHLIESDSNIVNRTEILNILSQDLPLEKAIELLRRVENGGSWEYLRKNMFPYMRAGIASFVMKKTVESKSEVVPSLIIQDQNIYQEIENEDSLQNRDEYNVIIPTKENNYRYIRPLALKTNLLFDLATLVNVELELPLSNRLSVAGEIVFPWWISEPNQRSLQINYVNIELRYWINRNYKKQDSMLGKHNPLAGWFVGVYGGGGLYDLEWDRKGYQDDNFVSAGITGGYVKPLSRNFSLELSLGLGALITNYQHYEARSVDNKWFLEKRHAGDYLWIGPTKAKVSLLWYPHLKKRVR